MSGVGQSLPKWAVGDMSGLPSIATEVRTCRHVSIVSNPDMARRKAHNEKARPKAAYRFKAIDRQAAIATAGN